MPIEKYVTALTIPKMTIGQRNTPEISIQNKRCTKRRLLSNTATY